MMISTYPSKFVVSSILQLLQLLLLLTVVPFGSNNSMVSAQPSYSNVTLKANKGDLEVVVYLPRGIKAGEESYYVSTRFEAGSMIGNIKRTIRREDGSKERHVLYDTQQWRAPHDPYWAESGVGLASEFGVGDDGDFCNFFCGWNQESEVTNGVLGYREAKNGESFLKIGVGELIKGSCTGCDSTEEYKFNNPYKFANTPVWTMDDQQGRGGGGKGKRQNSLALEHEAVLNQHGYKVRKDITLMDDQLLVKTTLTNIGRTPFATAWYSHHFFTCDSNPVGLGYGIDLDVATEYDEPATWSWSKPLENYAKVTPKEKVVKVDMQRGLERDVRIKAEFQKDESSKGSFTLKGCGTTIKESIPEIGQEQQGGDDGGGNAGVSMYAYNLYIETGTFSPEPQIFTHLFPGESSSWTQKLEFGQEEEEEENHKQYWQLFRLFDKSAVGSSSSSAAGSTTTKQKKNTERSNLRSGMSFVFSALVSAVLTLVIHAAWKRKRSSSSSNRGYTSIPDGDDDVNELQTETTTLLKWKA